MGLITLHLKIYKNLLSQALRNLQYATVENVGNSCKCPWRSPLLSIAVQRIVSVANYIIAQKYQFNALIIRCMKRLGDVRRIMCFIRPSESKGHYSPWLQTAPNEGSEWNSRLIDLSESQKNIPEISLMIKPNCTCPTVRDASSYLPCKPFLHFFSI